MALVISAAGRWAVSDGEIAGLLRTVYVDAGFTTAEEATTLFAPAAVRGRGELIVARDPASDRLAGMVIVVAPDSPARRLTALPGAELHLLGVRPEYRGQGLGRRLVEAALARAGEQGFAQLNLWTQHAMTAAQRVYEASGFRYLHDMERNGRGFKVYARSLAP